MKTNELLTTSDVARQLNAQGHRTPKGGPIKGWMVRRVYELQILPEPARRMGAYRVIEARDLPRVEAALRQAGYLAELPASVVAR